MGGTALALSHVERATFVVGTEGGALFKCFAPATCGLRVAPALRCTA
jgi:hypothetical protein